MSSALGTVGSAIRLLGRVNPLHSDPADAVYIDRSPPTELLMQTANSVNGVPIRLTYERWYHIVENHDEMASHYHTVLDVLEAPEFVLRGNNGALKATRSIGKRKWLVVVYREVSRSDGFVITAYLLDAKPKGQTAWRQH